MLKGSSHRLPEIVDELMGRYGRYFSELTDGKATSFLLQSGLVERDGHGTVRLVEVDGAEIDSEDGAYWLNNKAHKLLREFLGIEEKHDLDVLLRSLIKRYSVPLDSYSAVVFTQDFLFTFLQGEGMVRDGITAYEDSTEIELTDVGQSEIAVSGSDYWFRRESTVKRMLVALESKVFRLTVPLGTVATSISRNLSEPFKVLSPDIIGFLLDSGKVLDKQDGYCLIVSDDIELVEGEYRLTLQAEEELHDYVSGGTLDTIENDNRSQEEVLYFYHTEVQAITNALRAGETVKVILENGTVKRAKESGYGGYGFAVVFP